IVAGDDLDRDAKTVEAGERLLDVGFGRVGEAEEALEREAALVVSAETLGRERTAGDGNDACAGGEQPVEGRLGLAGDVRAAGENTFGRALCDQQPALRPIDQDRGELPLVVEREPVESRPAKLAV